MTQLKPRSIYLDEFVFFAAVVPMTLAVTAVEVVVGLVSLVTIPIVGWAALAPWERIRGMWALIGRHIRYILRYAFVPRLRSDLAAATERVDAPAVFGALAAMMPLSILALHSGVAVVCVLLTWGVSTRLYGVADVTTPPAAPVEVAFEPQVVDQQEADFGPWLSRGQVFERVNDAEFVNLALLSDDGSVKYSGRFTGNPTGFRPLGFHDRVRGVASKGAQVQFRDAHGNHFVLNPGQVFLFENYRSSAFMFSASGQLQVIAAVDLTTEELR